MKFSLFSFIFSCPLFLFAQFPGPAGTIGSTAIYKDSSIFVAWAIQCEYTPGWLNIADTSLGKISGANNDAAVGMAGENGTLSLGDAGEAKLYFQTPITNGPGPDFAVFENGFSDQYLEYAFVEVSSDDVHFVRFPATSYIQTQTQIGPFDYGGDATLLNNLAGKYRTLYGTPFDLNELADSANLNIDSIIVVKVVDVVGTISAPYARLDSHGNPINDPYPTAFPAGGFDLDAVGVIHTLTTARESLHNMTFSVYPNPVKTGNIIHLPDNQNVYHLYHSTGKYISSFYKECIAPTEGLYILETEKNGIKQTAKILVY